MEKQVVRCTVCNVDIVKSGWKDHLKSKKHDQNFIQASIDEKQDVFAGDNSSENTAATHDILDINSIEKAPVVINIDALVDNLEKSLNQTLMENDKKDKIEDQILVQELQEKLESGEIEECGKIENPIDIAITTEANVKDAFETILDPIEKEKDDFEFDESVLENYGQDEQHTDFVTEIKPEFKELVSTMVAQISNDFKFEHKSYGIKVINEKDELAFRVVKFKSLLISFPRKRVNKEKLVNFKIEESVEFENVGSKANYLVFVSNEDIAIELGKILNDLC